MKTSHESPQLKFQKNSGGGGANSAPHTPQLNRLALLATHPIVPPPQLFGTSYAPVYSTSRGTFLIHRNHYDSQKKLPFR